MSERLGASINPVEAAMPKAFVEGYTNAIRRVIPCAIMAEAQQIVEAHRVPGVPSGCEPLAFARILLVDDDPSVAASCKEMGEFAGNTVVIASSASKAKELIERGQFDRIVTDGLEGRWVDVWEEGTKKGIRTVVLSGSGRIVDEAKKRGAEAVLKSADEENFKLASGLFKNK